MKLKENKEYYGQYSDGVNGERKLWNVIWIANIRQKIRIFAWRAVSNRLFS